MVSFLLMEVVVPWIAAALLIVLVVVVLVAIDWIASVYYPH
jgi:hypothetical protein